MQLRLGNGIITFKKEEKAELLSYIQREAVSIEIRRVKKASFLDEKDLLFLFRKKDSIEKQREHSFEIFDKNNDAVRMNFIDSSGRSFNFKIEDELVYAFINFDYVPDSDKRIKRFETRDEINEIINNFFIPLFENEAAYQIGFYIE